MVEGNGERTVDPKAAAELPAAKKASILKQIGEFAVKLGQGAGSLAKRLAGIRDPEEAMRTIDAQLAENRARREPVSKRSEELYRQIVAKKKQYQAAPPARKKSLEMELKSALAEYQSLERQLAAYLKNETILTKVRGRMNELVAMNLKGISEAGIDKLTDQVEDAVDAADDLDGAIRDLDKAGIRREQEDDGSFSEALAAFGDELPDEPAGESPDPIRGVGTPAEPADPLADF